MALPDLFESSASVPLLGALVGLLVLFFSSSRNQGQGKDPPGPRPLPLIGNLLSMDFMKPHITLWEVRPLLFLFGPWSLPGRNVIHLIIDMLSIWLLIDWYMIMIGTACLSAISFPRNMEMYSQCIYEQRRWWSWLDTRQTCPGQPCRCIWRQRVNPINAYSF